MTVADDLSGLDRDRIREMFDLRSSANARSGAGYEADPNPLFHELRASGPVHPGTVHDLIGYPGDWVFHGLPSEGPSYSVFSYEACEAAFRNEAVFSSAPPAAEEGVSVFSSMFTMGGMQHRRYRSLVQPSFVPSRMQWWLDNWVEGTVNGLIDGFIADGRAELNVDFCAAIPVLTITGSFGVSVEEALEMRSVLANPRAAVEKLAPIVAARREEPQDDLISVLVQAEIKDEDGTSHRLSDPEIFSFAILLLFAGSGTTWKQMGITLGTLLKRPDLLDAIRQDRSLLRGAIEESVRWMPTDPMFSRWVTEDTDLHGVRIPTGATVHLCVGAANRDPARWERPDEYDISRPIIPTLGFGSGPHVCLGMHVARTEITAGVNALLDRLPGLRLDPDAEPPREIGLYERGMTAIPVIWE
jgi:cytochrome P450